MIDWMWEQCSSILQEADSQTEITVKDLCLKFYKDVLLKSTPVQEGMKIGQGKGRG